MHLLLAANWLLDPIVAFLWLVISSVDTVVKNYGWSLIVLAAGIRLLFWPFNTFQFKAMLAMQRIAPQIKKLQARFKEEPQKLQQETMALYKANKVNPLAGCWPMLLQYPVIISVYYVVLQHRSLFENQSWMWIGGAVSQSAADVKIFGVPVLAASLAHPDLILILLYAVSMYLSVRYVSMPATDPQQAQMQRMMSMISPLMLGFLGWKYQWPSAMVLYWFFYNVFTMGQQFYLLRRYHEPLSFADSSHVITEDEALAAGPAKALPKSAKTTQPSANGAPSAKKSSRPNSSRSKRKNKKGA
ncbi:MAG TPA: YidC/Oxa1 family membrane protein insertase [Candidatus Acidoferrales bacterium]|nr:YidC/Oxa1 family membrane protein insertase [Candidatus Acidoferrales bacterium]